MEQSLYNGVLPLGLAMEKTRAVSEADSADGREERYFDEQYDGYLGYGYNVITKRYYNSLDISLSAPILHPRAAGGGPQPLRIRTERSSHAETTNITGLFAVDYSKKLSAGAGLGLEAGAFKASFNTSFTQEKKVSTSKSFATRRHEITLVREYFDLSSVTAADLKRDYLSPGFRRDVNDPSILPADLFNRYGTHLLMDIRLGGRLELNFMHEKSQTETERSLEVSLEASYQCVSGHASTDQQNTAKTFSETSTFHGTLIGGAVSTDISTMEQAQAAYGKWAQSLDPAHCPHPSLAFIGTGSLSNPTSVIPVWQLADAADRQKALEKGFRTLLALNGGYFKELQEEVTTYLKDVYIGFGDTPDASSADVCAQMAARDPSAPRFVVYKDLNCSAGGKYIFLGYTTTTDPAKALRGLRGMTDPRAENCRNSYQLGGATYQKIPWDLNRGASGHFVFLYWSRDAAAGPALQDVDVEINHSGFAHYYQPGWSRVQLITGGDLNTNRGTGARTYDIFIWVKKTL